MTPKKESFFWTSYSDLMTSLFFVMMVLFILVIVLLHKRMQTSELALHTTEAKLQEIRKIEQSTHDLSSKYFQYRPDYKKYVLTLKVQFPISSANLYDIVDWSTVAPQLQAAGLEVQRFLHNHSENQYLLIIEGQASRDLSRYNYELSYQRALALMRFWINDSGIQFGRNCEILISGSGDGKLDTHSMREPIETENQRFLIHVLPKNIIDHESN